MESIDKKVTSSNSAPDQVNSNSELSREGGDGRTCDVSVTFCGKKRPLTFALILRFNSIMNHYMDIDCLVFSASWPLNIQLNALIAGDPF